MENIDCNYRLRGPRSPFGTKDQAAHYRTVRCQRKIKRGDQKIQTHQSLHQNFIVQKVSNTSMYLIMINALCNGCACSAVNRLEKETGKRTFPQRRFRSPMKGFDSYDFWPYNVPPRARRHMTCKEDSRCDRFLRGNLLSATFVCRISTTVTTMKPLAANCKRHHSETEIFAFPHSPSLNEKSRT
jgi:hypothetical protein